MSVGGWVGKFQVGWSFLSSPLLSFVGERNWLKRPFTHSKAKTNRNNQLQPTEQREKQRQQQEVFPSVYCHALKELDGHFFPNLLGFARVISQPILVCELASYSF